MQDFLCQGKPATSFSSTFQACANGETLSKTSLVFASLAVPFYSLNKPVSMIKHKNRLGPKTIINNFYIRYLY